MQVRLKVGKDYLFYITLTCIDINFKKWLRTKFGFRLPMDGNEQKYIQEAFDSN
jgi:hypothetical protein